MSLNIFKSLLIMDDDGAVNDPDQLRKNLAEYKEQLQEVRRLLGLARVIVLYSELYEYILM